MDGMGRAAKRVRAGSALAAAVRAAVVRNLLREIWDENGDENGAMFLSNRHLIC
jgi:hypothetical protein